MIDKPKSKTSSLEVPDSDVNVFGGHLNHEPKESLPLESMRNNVGNLSSEVQGGSDSDGNTWGDDGNPESRPSLLLHDITLLQNVVDMNPFTAAYGNKSQAWDLIADKTKIVMKKSGVALAGIQSGRRCQDRTKRLMNAFIRGDTANLHGTGTLEESEMREKLVYKCINLLKEAKGKKKLNKTPNSKKKRKYRGNSESGEEQEREENVTYDAMEDEISTEILEKQQRSRGNYSIDGSDALFSKALVVIREVLDAHIKKDSELRIKDAEIRMKDAEIRMKEIQARIQEQRLRSEELRLERERFELEKKRHDDENHRWTIVLQRLGCRDASQLVTL